MPMGINRIQCKIVVHRNSANGQTSNTDDLHFNRKSFEKRKVCKQMTVCRAVPHIFMTRFFAHSYFAPNQCEKYAKLNAMCVTIDDCFFLFYQSFNSHIPKND